MPLIGGLIGPLDGQGTGGGGGQLALSDGLACFTASFSGVTTTSISHGLGTTDIVVEFKDATGNLLIPDNWRVLNNNSIEVEFLSPTQGDLIVIGCIESGLAPIQGGVTLLEGLSGIIDLDSPNDSILISTSGQVINLEAIFTPGSGAVLEQTREDIDTLSGLIGTSNAQGVSLDFTTTSGTEFVMYHGLGTSRFVWDMWTTDTVPDCIVRPENVVGSGVDHIIVTLDTPMNGYLNLIGIGV